MDIYAWLLIGVIAVSGFCFIRGYVMYLQDKKHDAKNNGRSRTTKRQDIKKDLEKHMKNKRSSDKEDK